MERSVTYIRRVRLEHREDIKYKVYCANEYKGTLENDIKRFKYHGHKYLGNTFGEYIYKNLPKLCNLHDYDFLLPIPSKPLSISRYGYDRLLLIGEHLSELCELPLARNILKTSDYPSQTRLSESERRANVKGKFRLIDPSCVKGKSFLVLDDVFTTGSTLDEVIQTLSTADPRQLDVVVLAKTPFRY